MLFQIHQKLSQGFSALWARYPLKKAKQDAEKAFGQVVKTPEIEAQIHAALDWQIPEWEALDWYTPPLLGTYLRKGRYTDEPTKPTKPKTPKVTVSPTIGRRLDDHMKQQNINAQIQFLVRSQGLSLDEAKRKVYIEQGWIKDE